MGILSDSMTVCRLCGLASENTLDIFRQEELPLDLSFYLPLEVSCHFLTLAVLKVYFVQQWRGRNQFSHTHTDQSERAVSQENM